MKLGEALTLRGDLQARVSELRNRLKESARVQEGEKPHEDPSALLKEFRRRTGLTICSTSDVSR